jgi:hypothetical protein
MAPAFGLAPLYELHRMLDDFRCFLHGMTFGKISARNHGHRLADLNDVSVRVINPYHALLPLILFRRVEVLNLKVGKLLDKGVEVVHFKV